jgi:hypothetical protein
MREDITKRLQAILSKWMKAQHAAQNAAQHAAPPKGAAIEFESATPDEVFDFLDKELGSL